MIDWYVVSLAHAGAALQGDCNVIRAGGELEGAVGDELDGSYCCCLLDGGGGQDGGGCGEEEVEGCGDGELHFEGCGLI